MENGKWQIQRWMFTATLTVFSKAVCHPLPEGPRFRRRVAENAYTVMGGKTRILFSFLAHTPHLGPLPARGARGERE
jgi:hypothetical protein